MKTMKKIILIVAAAALALVSCTREQLSTDQYSDSEVILKAYGPQPVVRGGTLRFIGSNLDKVKSVTIPADNVITDIEVVASGKHSEIRVTVPKETAEVGYPVLTLADGKTITGKTLLEYSEPITIDKFSPAEVLPGAVVTIEGDYLNLIHEVIFADKVKVSEKDFTTHTRYKIAVKVPETAQTGKIGLGTVDELAIAGEEDEEALLATLNIVESETALVVTTAKGTLAKTTLKAGETLTINGSNLNLVKSVELAGASVTEFTATATALSFALPATATDGDVLMVMASGVEVKTGTLTTVVPTDVAVSPSPVKNGATITITGKDLDLVDAGIEFPGGVWAEYDNATATSVSFAVPEKAQQGDIVLHLSNGKTVSVAYTLVRPVVTGFSANPAAAGSDVTIDGTDLDLVAAVTFGGDIKVDVEAAETAITVAVPTAAETGVLVLNLKNGEDVEAIELAIDKPAGAYLPSAPADVLKAGDMLIVDIVNGEHLQQVLIGEEDVTFILNNGKLYVSVPSGVKVGAMLTLVSDNGTVTYPLNIDPGDRIVTNIWSGSSTVTWGGGAVTALSWGGYDWSQVKPGIVLSVTYTIDNPGGCIRFGNGSWASIPSLAGLATDGNLPLQEGGHKVVLTEEDIKFLVDNGGFVLCGDGYTVTSIDLIELIPQETTIWSGSSTVTWGGGAVTALSWGGYDWSTVTPGTAIIAHYTIDDPSGAIRFGNGSWASIPSGIPFGDSDGNISLPEGSTSFSITLTEEDIKFLVDNGGFVLCGTGYTVTSIGLLIMPEP